ncbi:hypothetical protein BSZ40_01610 [Buchananella hordeovulneris]|uniref:Uncharacterized protein n=2 Tax=Buchananella hordeovulneris TaxID=52770 RepID=A0A1Q5PZE5_9ACTO|nr:hypothetical protein BSZ40_01610 [Buchananella hordeovulneris]
MGVRLAREMNEDFAFTRLNTQSGAVVEPGDVSPFYAEVRHMLRDAPQRELADWLRALAGLVTKSAHTEPTRYDILQLLQAALTVDAADLPLEEASAPPQLPGDDEGVVLPAEQARQRALGVIAFQLADLRKLAAAGTLHDPHRFFGVVSPTGNYWYNFTPEAFIECGAAGLADTDREDTAGWDLLALWLEFGRLYE